MTNHALLISIRPRFVEAIFAKTKSVELRRVKPRLEAGQPFVPSIRFVDIRMYKSVAIRVLCGRSEPNLWTTPKADS